MTDRKIQSLYGYLTPKNLTLKYLILIDLKLTQHIQFIQALFDLVTLKATLIIP